MFRLFGPRENPHRRAARLEFEEATRQLRKANDIVQSAVGHAINVAHTFFAKRFVSLEAFTALAKDQKLQYIHSLTNRK